MIRIQNEKPALSADPTALGLAVKAIIAGGSKLPPEGIRVASGASPHIWTRKGAAIVQLVHDLEAEGA